MHLCYVKTDPALHLCCVKRLIPALHLCCVKRFLGALHHCCIIRFLHCIFATLQYLVLHFCCIAVTWILHLRCITLTWIAYLLYYDILHCIFAARISAVLRVSKCIVYLSSIDTTLCTYISIYTIWQHKYIERHSKFSLDE